MEGTDKKEEGSQKEANTMVETEPKTTRTEETQNQGDESSSQNRRVYVGNLAWEVSWQDLKDLNENTINNNNNNNQIVKI